MIRRFRNTLWSPMIIWAQTEYIIQLALLGVRSALVTLIEYSKWLVTSLCFLTKSVLINDVVAPESTKAFVCTYFLYTHNVIWRVKLIFELQEIFNTFDSVTIVQSTILNRYPMDTKFLDPRWQALFRVHWKNLQGFNKGTRASLKLVLKIVSCIPPLPLL